MRKKGDTTMEKVIQIPLTEIRFFGGAYGIGYFRVRPQKVEELAESIREIGIQTPLIVRPDEHGAAKYELIAGQTRFTAAKRIGLETVPCVIRNLDDQAALCIYGESNRYRNDITITEKAFMARYTAEYTDSKKSKTDPQVRTANFDEAKERQLRRYIRLTYLTLGMRNLVDSKKISIKAGCAASYLPYEIQDKIVNALRGQQLTLTQETVERIRSVYDNQRRPYGKTLTMREVSSMIEQTQPEKAGMTHVAISKHVIRSLPLEYQSRKAYEPLIEELLKNFSEEN